ncbi:MAG: hypothetical protein M9917_09840 [Bosea sp.]|nr:hypothetical protein [Bosea sp. (in: a-proteobacteria)]MCO5091302.1 hypothetical protein [Bosea sp. (in: a-proteobacteria)]
MSVGLERLDDLLDDVEQALNAIRGLPAPAFRQNQDAAFTRRSARGCGG